MSLVVSTIGRPDDLARLVASIEREVAAGVTVELIVVDQSGSLEVMGLLASADVRFPIRCATSALGVSRGRNTGLDMAVGAYVMFPDDDAWFPGAALAQAVAHLDAHPDHDGFSMQLRTAEGEPSMLRWTPTARFVTLRNHHRTSIGSTMLFRVGVARAVGGFDIGIGPGSDGWFGSCEDADFLLRVIEGGARIWYEPSVVVYHRDSRGDIGLQAEQKALSYGCGQGWLWRTHRFPRWLVASLLARRLAAGLVLMLRGRGDIARVQLGWMRGALNGLMGEPPIDLMARPEPNPPKTRQRRLRSSLGTAPTSAALAAPATAEFWRSFSWRLAMAPLGTVATFAFAAMAARTLDDDAVNVVYALLTALMIGPILSRFGLHQEAVRAIAAERTVRGEGAATALARRHLISSLRRTLLANPVIAVAVLAGVYGDQDHLAHLVLASVVLSAESIRLTTSDVLAGLGHTGWAAALAHQVRAVLVMAVLVVQTTVLGIGVTVVGILSLMAGVTVSLLAVGLLRLWRLQPRPPSAHPLGLSLVTTPPMPRLALGLPFLLVDLVAVLVARGDVLLAGRAFQPDVAVLYSTASVLAAQLSTPMGLASVALAPVVAGQVARGGLDELEHLLRTLATAAAAMAAPV
ncbi:MAG: glycosyltransferase, partial [Acidimicrobiia bacterium]|nr:glycosyltransferase [Acidimicrobiia bacterium]